ncbi:MAG: redoxin domain-containing protein [Candidatus Hydrogenedentes bacterium]|nr:redoxin domain-containing protein [Candidatus Hydrogenedentota bacterium]
MVTESTFGEAPEFDGAAAWVNTAEPVRLAELRGKIVLVDFWSQCCINCIHVLDDLAYLENKYRKHLVIVGVHSGKFEHERSTDSVRLAVERYGVRYPVANDAEYRIWKAYGAQAWPTLCLIDPNGQVAAAYSGEGRREDLDKAVARLIAEHHRSGTLDESHVLALPPRIHSSDGDLLFPGKVLVDPESLRVFIADSFHHRILVCHVDGTVVDVVGTGKAGLQDGAFEEAEFRAPHGMALKDNVLYVADTQNHAIRALYLEARRVATFGGNGTQGNFKTMTGGPGTLLSSPWDVAIVDNMLYVAMAGTHQIWRAAVETRNFRLFAGSGMENLADGPGPSAQLAQPSGMAVAGHYLYFADSEVSALRRANLRSSGDVETLIGAGLFEFGDRVGPAKSARLQHPLGVCWYDGKIYIADTYNHRIKAYFPADRTVHHVAGTGSAGRGTGTGASFWEPSGISAAGGRIYIADTNNHRIATLDLETGEVADFALTFPA